MRWWAARLSEEGSTLGRFLATLFLGLAHLLLGLAYAVPGLGVANALVGMPSQVSIVSTIDNYGPWWVLGYGVSGASLIVATMTRRLLPQAHLLGLSVVGAFAFAVWWGTFASHPNRSIVTGVLASGWAFWHLFLMLAYTEEQVKERRAWKP